MAKITTATKTVTYDAAASGVIGAMQIINRCDNQYFTIARDLLVDYTGDTGDTTTPAGWIYMVMDDTSGTGFRVNGGVTLTITGYKGYGGAHDWSFNAGGGTIKWRPDADAKGYLYADGATGVIFAQLNLDFSDLAVIESMNRAGTGVTTRDITTRPPDDNSNPANSRAVIVGRTDGATQRFAAKDSVAGTDAYRNFLFICDGMEGRYGNFLQVAAVGTDASPNLVIMEKEAIAGLAFYRNTSTGGGGWVKANPDTLGVARLVLEGNFYTQDITHAGARAQWNMSQIQLQMGGEKPLNDPGTGDPLLPLSFQQFTWFGVDRNAGGTLPYTDPAYFDYAGYTNNAAVRKLLIGSDEGTGANGVRFLTSTNGSAMCTWGLEFTPGGYLYIENADDYVYWLSTSEAVSGVKGTGLVLPAGTTLADFTNRPENIRMVGRWPGDADLSLSVDYLDLGALAGSYRQSGKTWAEGDFTGDGSVDYLDLGVLAGNYRSGPMGYVPEPLTLGLLALAWPALRRRTKA